MLCTVFAFVEYVVVTSTCVLGYADHVLTRNDIFCSLLIGLKWCLDLVNIRTSCFISFAGSFTLCVQNENS